MTESVTATSGTQHFFSQDSLANSLDYKKDTAMMDLGDSQEIIKIPKDAPREQESQEAKKEEEKDKVGHKPLLKRTRTKPSLTFRERDPKRKPRHNDNSVHKAIRSGELSGRTK